VLVDVGGWGAVMAKVPENTFRLLPLEHTHEHWLNYLRAWTIIGLVDISAQTLLQRALAAKDERTAQNSFYLGSLAYLVFGMIPVLLGIIGSVTLPELSDSEAVVPTLAIEHLHPIGVATFVGAMLAAIMSSADSALLACASILANNVVPMFKPNPPAKLSLLVARVAIPVCGFLAIFVALKIQMVFDLILNANVLVLAVIIVPFIVGVWWKKANRTGALASMAAGFSAWALTLFLAPSLPADFIGLLASLVTILVVTPLTQTFDPPTRIVDCDGAPIDLSDRLGTLPLFGKD